MRRMSNESIEERLRREKPEHSAPVGFTERVMTRLADPVAKRENRPALLWPRLSLAIAVLAIAGVFAFEFFSPFHQGQIAEGAPQSVVPAPNEAASTAGLEIPRITPEQFQALATKLDQPLEKELENVISDTRIAIQFVASNFLPEK